jgi:hypothetical protein
MLHDNIFGRVGAHIGDVVQTAHLKTLMTILRLYDTTIRNF